MTPILSTATLGYSQVLKFVQKRNLDPTWPLSIVESYWNIAHRLYGVNPIAAIAQACLETDYFLSTPAGNWNNFCGLGVVDGQWEFGLAFRTIDRGVHAHCAHLLGYTTALHNQLCRLADPRHALAFPHGHLSKIVSVTDLNNSGWSAVSTDYGTKIQTIIDEMGKA